jgi:hypothetical protein
MAGIFPPRPICIWVSALSTARFSAVANPHHKHQEPFFLDAFENPILANPNAPSFAMAKLLASRRPRIMRKLIDGSRNSLSGLSLYAGQVFGRLPSDLDPMGQAAFSPLPKASK